MHAPSQSVDFGVIERAQETTHIIEELERNFGSPSFECQVYELSKRFVIPRIFGGKCEQLSRSLERARV